MQRTCLTCEDKLVGRIDKKFCSDQCRNTYNNQLNSDSTKYVRRVNGILRRNRRILTELNPENDKAKVSGQKLREMGFNFGYFTNTTTTNAGKTYYFCYEHGYLPLENDVYLLVMRREGR